MPGISRWTLIAIAVVAYALANVAHEGLGHGGMCVATGGTPVALSAVSFECDKSQLSEAAAKWISAGGTLVNLLLAAGAWLFARRARRQSGGARLFWWLFFSVNALQAAGYWLFSGVGNVGDWAGVVGGSVGWRVVRAVVGTAAYYGAIGLSVRWLSELVGPGPERIALARLFTLLPYVMGAVLYVSAGVFNPHGWRLVVISAAAASLGGTSALAWMYNLLRDPKRPTSSQPALQLEASKAWLGAAGVVAVLFIAVLGPSIRL
jgi:hypothetical protein